MANNTVIFNLYTVLLERYLMCIHSNYSYYLRALILMRGRNQRQGEHYYLIPSTYVISSKLIAYKL